jgi:hypothetical protein
MIRLLKFRLIYIICCLVFGFSAIICPSVSAISQSEAESIYTDTTFYDPLSIGDPSCSTTLLGSDNAEQAWNFFKSTRGGSLSDKQIAAILGNFKEESGINPRRVQGTKTPEGDSDINPLDGKTGYGIAQWTNIDRQQNLSKFAADTSRPVSSLDLQLDFVFHEMTDTSPDDIYDHLKTMDDINLATRYFQSSFEASADSESGIQQRVLAAIRYYNLYSGTSPLPDPSPGQPVCGGSGPGSACTSGDILGWTLSGSCQMVSYDQGDSRWANVPYGDGKSPIADSGCGPTSLAMVGATLLNNTAITPETVAIKYGNQYHIAEGTSWGLFPVYAADNNLGFKDLGTDLNAAAGIIRSGGLVVISVDPGYFTSAGHLMVIRAVNPDGTLFYLADPNGDGVHGDSETRGFSADFLRSQGSMKHLWGYTK